MEIVEKFKKSVKQIISSFEEEIKGVRANRPSAALVEDIKVNYYDAETPLKHISSISIVPPREINIQLWDKDIVSTAAAAIESANLGVSVNAEGNSLRIFLPELSAERRTELAKQVKKMSEQYRIRIRTARDEINKEIDQMLAEDQITEDDKFSLKEKIQKETVAANGKINEILEAKIKEINT